MPNPHLPPELLDQIVDLLYDVRDALKACCLVSKSWIPRARRHLFSHIAFRSTKNLQSWKTLFPDPSTSPASYTRFLLAECSQVITDADAEKGGWIPTFSQVVHFEVGIYCGWSIDELELSLTPFHGFSPALKSLRINFADISPSCVSDFIHSFPRLQDLAVTTLSFERSDSFHAQSVTVQSSTPSAFTGSLKISMSMGMNSLASRLLSLPTGLHFRKLSLTWNREEDVPLTMAFVEECSSTLETLEIKCGHLGTTVQHQRSHQRLTSANLC